MMTKKRMMNMVMMMTTKMTPMRMKQKESHFDSRWKETLHCA